MTANYWNTNDPQQFYGVFAAFVGVQLILLTAAITLILLKESGDARHRLNTLATALHRTAVTPLKDYEFYVHFRNAIERAEHSVWIAYLAPYPPSEVASRERKRYDDEILGLMKRREKVSFRRLIRQSPKNDEWVAELLEHLRGRPNVDIGVLACDLPPGDEMPLALSVQVVDGDKVWFVAAGSHQTTRSFRDVYIENSDVGTAMSEYYDRIWSKSVVVLDHGRVTEDGLKLIAGSEL